MNALTYNLSDACHNAANLKKKKIEGQFFYRISLGC